jgi:hypothetical protein
MTMADVEWPPTLPKGQTPGFSESPAGVLASWSPGAWQKPLRRKRVSGKASIVAYSFVMTAAQMAIFRAFWEDDLASGVNDIVFVDESVNAPVRLTPTAEYEAANIAPDAYQVSIQCRRELVT